MMMKKKDIGPENNYVMVALVHVYNLFNALNEQQAIFFMFFTPEFKI